MTRLQAQVMYGSGIAVTGAIIALLSYNPSDIIQYLVAAGIMLSGVFALVTAKKSRTSEIRLKYHELQGFGMLAYAAAILTFAQTFEKFISITMAFLLYFGITEIIFGLQLMAYKTKVNMSIIIRKMITGFLLTLGALAMLVMSFSDKNISLLFAGLLFASSGINFILFAKAGLKPRIAG